LKLSGPYGAIGLQRGRGTRSGEVSGHWISGAGYAGVPTWPCGRFGAVLGALLTRAECP